MTGETFRLIKSTRSVSELGEGVGLGVRVLKEVGLLQETAEELRASDELQPKTICFLAGIEESLGRFTAVKELLEGQTDPLLVRFHAALLERRGELTRAVESLSVLEKSEEGRKGSYLRELAEMMRRAGMMDEALATTERWKQATPGDRAAWLFCSDLLTDRGELEAAIRELRQAAARFEDDPDLKARLAGLYRDSGSYAEATSILWRLYDEADEQAAQTRWSAELARTALTSGRTVELEEQLVTRSRLNRKAVGPLLARAALAGELGEKEKQRDLLLQAVRLQPRDLNLRLQVARAAEESGDSKRAIAVLEEALAFDQNDRVRNLLAETYLRAGEVEKALRMMRQLTDDKKQTADDLVLIANSLARKNYHEEAMALLREKRTTLRDAKLDLTLASMMIEDGREDEAARILLELLGRTPVAPAPASHGRNSPAYLSYLKQYPAEVRDLLDSTRIIERLGRSSRARSPFSSTSRSTGMRPKEARLTALSKLAQLMPFLPGEKQKEMENLILSVEMDHIALYWQLVKASEKKEELTKVFESITGAGLAATAARLAGLMPHWGEARQSERRGRLLDILLIDARFKIQGDQAREEILRLGQQLASLAKLGPEIVRWVENGDAALPRDLLFSLHLAAAYHCRDVGKLEQSIQHFTETLKRLESETAPEKRSPLLKGTRFAYLDILLLTQRSQEIALLLKKIQKDHQEDLEPWDQARLDLVNFTLNHPHESTPEGR